ncbi:ubiquitin carboxyl-terminal hydrolase, putative [Eimeria tenella]|uniref:Ubiquitin carboxyl-terminal hydrolase, putative n=1 Tax=Eimeria tenella TaxID=5802 RepID=U6KMU4_EIMTE|nr:ubiquitin carboxyl-terminal hydrolase, putative [Eimeria tenella]CDJ37602.1 ubiquitin carboxyl-terminal hydrolase, putative [Eimeria tenella]|eukprot:XP_013228440.1 ubiquitin carboxyl-terminal hydrolase, putative [Eimeria tenella]
MSKQQQQLLLQQHGMDEGDTTPPASPVDGSEMQQQQSGSRRPPPLSPSTPVSSQQQQQQQHAPVPDYSLKSLPPPSTWELDFTLPSFLSRYASSSSSSSSSSEPLGEEVLTVYSEWRDTPAVRFRLMLHPVSPVSGGSAGGRERRYLGAFVETARRADFPEDWVFQHGLRFYIYAINPVDYRQSLFKQDTYHFACDDADRGWHHFASHQELIQERFLGGPTGEALYLRAGCTPVCAAVSRRIRTPCPPAPLPPPVPAPAAAAAAAEAGAKRQQQLQQGEVESPRGPPAPFAGIGPAAPPAGAAPAGGAAAAAAGGMGRCGRGYVGLRNHGATCYMNALLQSLYFIGKFREAVYALSFDTKNTCGPRSVDILERRRCRRKRGRAFAAAGLDRAKRGEAPAAAAEAAAAAGVDGAETEGRDCNGVGGEPEGQMDVEGQSPSSAVSEGAAGAPAAAAAAAGSFSEESTDSEDELSDLEESELRDLLLEEEAGRRSPPSISLALQNLFVKLFTAEEAVPYKDLIRSFGWDAADAFTQQDTHELLKLLLDKVEEQMRGTPAEGSVKAMFEGEMETYVECLHVDYKSARKEAFEDINLDVQGCSGVRESLQRLVVPELLEGDNAYDAEQHGKQTARKGVRFVRFPPVCVFLLKRFDFDFARMDTVKVFDRYEFERELDLNEFCEGAGVYALHSVSVHQGDVNSGHYYSFLRPAPGTQWMRFDDEKVYHVSEYAAIGDNFGGEELECYNYLRGERKPRTRNKPYNAYILVYVNKTLAPSLLADCSPLKVNPQILSRCRTEEQLRRLRTSIRNVLEKSVRVKVYHPLQFKYRRFLELPYLSVTPILDLKRSRDSQLQQLHETISHELTRLLYGGGGSSKGSQGSSGSQSQGSQGSGGDGPPRVQFMLHLINTSVESPRFDAIELGPNAYLGEILRRKGGGGGAGVEVSLHVLAVPEKAVFSSPLQHDEFVRCQCLLFIKYFSSLSRTAKEVHVNKAGQIQQPQQQQQPGTDAAKEENVICLDVVYVPYEWKVRDLEPHVYRLIHQAMQDGVIDEGPARAAEVARMVSFLPSNLPPLSCCAPYPSPLPSPLPPPASKAAGYPCLQWTQGSSAAAAAAAEAAAAAPIPTGTSTLQLTACLELDITDKMQTERLVPRKTVRNSKIYSGDLLVYSVDLPQPLLEYREAQQKVGCRPEDLAPQQAYNPSSLAEEGHSALEAAAAAAAAGGAPAGGDATSSLVPWGGGPPKEVRGLSLLPFVPRARGGNIPPSPPPLPVYLCNDFVDFCLESQATEVYHVRLYDPFEFLGKVMSSSGCLLLSPSLPQAAGPEGHSALLSEASLVSLGSSDGGWQGGEETPLGSPGVPQHPTGPAGESTATLGAPTEAAAAGAATKSKTEDAEEDAALATPVADDPWLHMPKTKPICVKEFSLSGRLPARQALQWIAWHFGVDPSQLLLFPEPPLLSDRKVVPLDIDAMVVSAEVTREQQQQQMLLIQKGEREAPGKRQLSLDELYMQLQAAQSWPGCLDRRRTLAAATAASAAAGGTASTAAAAARLPRELHLCLLPGHFRLYSRIVNALTLPSQQQQQLQQLLLSPLSPAALSPSSSPLSHTVFTYICLIFSRQAERIGCVLGHIAACSSEGRPHTVADLMRDILSRLSPATVQTLRQDYRLSCSSSSSSSSGAAAAATATAAAKSTAAEASTCKQDFEEDLGPLKLSISDASHLLRIPPTEELSWLTLYAPSAQSRSREAISNLLAVPLRLEADYTPEEEELIRTGARQVLLVQHQTPGDREPFGYPFDILVEPEATLSEIKAQIIKKLRLPKNAWGSCTFFQLGDGVRCWKGPNDSLDWVKHRNITLIAEHSAPYTKHRGHGGMRIA